MLREEDRCFVALRSIIRMPHRSRRAFLEVTFIVNASPKIVALLSSMDPFSWCNNSILNSVGLIVVKNILSLIIWNVRDSHFLLKYKIHLIMVIIHFMIPGLNYDDSTFPLHKILLRNSCIMILLHYYIIALFFIFWFNFFFLLFFHLFSCNFYSRRKLSSSFCTLMIIFCWMKTVVFIVSC